MKTTLRTLSALFVCLLLVQCTEEDLNLSNELALAEALSKSKATDTKLGNRGFGIAALAVNDYDDTTPGVEYEFTISGIDGNISVSWGDGSTTSHPINHPTFDNVRHAYGSANRYLISITGDLDKITRFESYYGLAEFSGINFRNLTNLQEVGIGLTKSSSIIDLSRNTQLVRISFSGMQQLEKVILPKKHNIKQVNLEGPFNFDGRHVDDIIDNIYQNAVLKNLSGGYFSLPAQWAQDESDKSMVGPPSADSIDKLRILKNSYGWLIYPSLDEPNI